jgi:hypothetical protein
MANLTALRMDLTSGFPRKSEPRQGFVAQFSTDASFENDVHTVTVPETLNTGVIETQVDKIPHDRIHPLEVHSFRYMTAVGVTCSA